jgi:cell division septation protein DedD
MAARRHSGLTIGQSVTLVFAFALGSVMIFALGIWVGRESSRQREKDDRAVVVRPVATLPVRGAPGAAPTPTAAAGERPALAGEPSADQRPTRPRLLSTVLPSATTTRTAAPSRTPTRRPPPTDTPRRDTPTPARRVATSEVGGMWTVQAATTNDQVQALVAARRLRAKGYEAFTSQTEIGGVPWYRIQVGRFEDRRDAEEMVRRLRKEGMNAAFAERIR